MGPGLLRNAGRILFQGTRGAGAIAQTVVTRVLTVCINAGTGIISARLLGSTGRGELSAMLLWPPLIAYLLTLGLPSAIRYWIRREPDRRVEFFTVAVLAAGVSSLVAIAIGVSFIPDWLRNYPPNVIRGAQIMMSFSPEVMIAMILSAMLEALGDFNTANKMRYASVSLTLLALVALAASHRMTPFTAAIAYTSMPVLVAFWIVWKLRSYFSLRVFDPRPAMRVLGSYGVRSYGIDLLNTIATQVDQVLVIAFLSASDVGIYVVALNASRVINTVLHSSIVTVVFPSASGLNEEGVVGIVGRSARIGTAIAVVFGATLILALPFLIPAFYGSPFGGAVRVAQILTVEAVVSGLVSILAQAFMALGRPGIITILQSVGLALELPLLILLLPRFALIGAAFALLLSTVLRLVLVAGAYPLVLRIPVPGLIPVREDFQRLRSALANR